MSVVSRISWYIYVYDSMPGPFGCFKIMWFFRSAIHQSRKVLFRFKTQNRGLLKKHYSISNCNRLSNITSLLPYKEGLSVDNHASTLRVDDYRFQYDESRILHRFVNRFFIIKKEHISFKNIHWISACVGIKPVHRANLESHRKSTRTVNKRNSHI